MNVGKIKNILLALVLILLPTQLGLHFWPSWSIVDGLRVDYFSPTLYLTDIIVLILGIVTVIDRIKNRRVTNSLQIVNLKITTVLFLLLVLFVLLNTLSSLSPPVSFFKWLKLAELAFLIWIVGRQKFSSRMETILVTGLFLTVGLQAVLVLWQFVGQHSVGGWWYFLGERSFSVNTPGIAKLQLFDRLVLRPYGTFSHPNVLGGFLAITIPWLLLVKTAINKYFQSVIIVLSFVALLITFSRLSILVGLLLTIIVFWPRVKQKTLRLVLIILGMVASLLIFQANFGTQEESYNVRSQLNQIGWQEFSLHPLWGTGLGTSPIYTLNHEINNLPLRTSNFSLFGQPIHNLYLLILAETGLVGFLLLLTLIYKILMVNNRQICWMFLAVLFLGLFDHYWLTSQQGLLFLAILVGWLLPLLKSQASVK